MEGSYTQLLELSNEHEDIQVGRNSVRFDVKG